VSTGTDSIEVEIRWPDIDWYGHVSHMALVTIAEHGRNRWIDATLEILPETWPYVIARLELDFRAPADFTDRTVVCGYTPTRVGQSSITLEEKFSTPGGTLVMEAVSVIVAWDQEMSTTRPLTADEASRLRAAGGLTDSAHTEGQ
jgi:acyl-CoA thioester hydrolase